LTNETGGKVESGRFSILRAPGYEHVGKQWFLPSFWGELAGRVADGGRGSAWFIESENNSFVLRHYRRGGIAAKFSKRRYLFGGFKKTRSFAEFRLTFELSQRGLPVPNLVAALAVRKNHLTYEAAILMERIPGAQPLPACSEVSDEGLWHRVGKVIGAFHREGLDHVDLNCDNILITDDSVYLIDFDRCKLRTNGEGQAGWKVKNLERLHRSVCKRLSFFSDKKRAGVWQALMTGYHTP
jgi:3-deoxy-D-manno-octulosonic acid kinase